MAGLKVFVCSSFNSEKIHHTHDIPYPGCYDCNPDDNRSLECKQCWKNDVLTMVVVCARTWHEACEILNSQEKEQPYVKSHCVNGCTVTVSFDGIDETLEFERIGYCVGINTNPDVAGTIMELDMEANTRYSKNGLIETEFGDLDVEAEEEAKKNAERTALLQKREALIRAKEKELAELDAQLANL